MLLALTVGCARPSERAPDQVRGVIAEIGRVDDGSIAWFTVRDGEASYRILIDRTRDYGFDLEHLEEHRASALPVRVRLDQREDGLYAVEIVDA